MYRHRLLLLAIFAAVCTTAVSVSRRSRAGDNGDDKCAFECGLGSPTWTPDSSGCYDACVESSKSSGCNASGHAP